MIPQFQHNLTTSFAMWVDHYLLEKGQSYTNRTGIFYNYNDVRIPDSYQVFGSEYKQFVYEQMSGVNNITGVYVNGVFRPRGPGTIIDHINGRVLLTGVSAGATVSGAFPVKDFNVYMTTDNEEKLIVENSLSNNTKYPWSGKYLQPYTQLTPAVFVINEGYHNTPFSFGGEDETRSSLKCVAMTDNPYHLDGVLSIFADSVRKVFKEKQFGDYPLTEYGDVKTYPYAYDDYYDSPEPQAELFIDDVVVSKLKDSKSLNANPKVFVGMIDFEVIKYRYPRR